MTLFRVTRALVAMGIVGVAACGERAAASPFVGTWQIDPGRARATVQRFVDDKYGADAERPAQVRSMTDTDLAKFITSELEIRSDGTYSNVGSVLGLRLSIAGTWTPDGPTLHLVPRAVEGDSSFIDGKAPITCTLSGEVLTCAGTPYRRAR
jgi:hypothetical protein